MIRVFGRKTVPDKALVDTLKKVDTATIGHILEFGFAIGIKTLLPTKVVGPALTVRAPAMDSAAVHLALDYAAPGDILVVDRGGDQVHACLGGTVAYACTKKGICGALVDGAITDTQELIAYRFPVFYKSISPLTTKILGYQGEINSRVSVGGVAVEPGDLIVADSDGVVVLPPQEVVEVARRALELQERSKETRRKLDSGVSLSSISGANKYIQEQL